ncbi:glycogen debranching N-terminal domain-containing protein, partial [Streptomyces lushanensis]|uniref:glycogen debranching N-terminal domain-containing protein n=1 Tax=Streptomyces lushanensis TaxID=1434255 RepID=UPI00316AC56F
LSRRRAITPGRLEETLEVINAGRQNVRFRLSVTAATDLALMERVKTGETQPTVAATASEGGFDWSRGVFA